MAKRKKKNTNKYSVLAGAKVLNVVENNYCTEVQLVLANGKKQSIGIYEEGSYSDWWETYVHYRPNEEIVSYTETISDNEPKTITIHFYNSENKTVLEIDSTFHNDSDWDYGCYLHLSAEDIGIREYYYV